MTRKRALPYIISLLARREYSRHELLIKLQRYELEDGFDPECLLDELCTADIISDKRFCESLLNQHLNNYHGPLRLAQKLQQKGVPRHVSDQVLAQHQPDWYEVANQAFYKRFSGHVESDLKAMAKQVRYLYGRGFPSEVAHNVINQAQRQKAMA